MDQVTFEANARSIHERFTGARRDLMLHVNDAGGEMGVFDLLARASQTTPANVVLPALVRLRDDGYLELRGWVVRLP